MAEYRKDFREIQREYYWSVPRIFMMLLLAVIGLGSIGFGLNYFGFAQFAFFAPKYEAVRRDVMIESRAYSEATTRQMYNLKLQYQQAKSDDERATIKAMALHESAAFDKARLPVDLRVFLDQLGG